MTLREEFENELRKNKTLATVLFETSNKYYIGWLEAKVKALRQGAVSDSVCECEQEYGHKWNTKGDRLICVECEKYV